ncbi:hypothetical protein [Sandaracinus amylolyticus]|uniref:hypothetical protein n=1 Tax=Sandaracinus amylolyticus TaxID=927083 RepID=UPI001F2B6540|nr:hypothetical protein [Sandaracinus amylolyticus]UJR79976.1 Hypothetical protein I5071_20190 [Sandaracinus amylolyticus]
MNDPLARRSAAVGWIASIALHAGLLVLATIALAPPDTGFEFQAPIEVELGLVEATEVEVEVAPPATAPEPASEPATTTSGSTTGEGETAARDAGVVADAAARRRRRDAGVDGAMPGLSEGAPVAFLPAGAQLALRIDMDRVRGSPVGEDIASLLRVVPDWRALLGESGVDPVRDLSRVLIATPNLQRSSIVVAGRLSEGAPDPRALAERFAQGRGVPIEWRDEAGVPSTRWPSPDGIERDVALVGERHFVIARPDDLPRVLAIAAARRARRATVEPADALLAMDEGEGLSIEVENVAVFVRRSPCPVPLRLRVGVTERDDGAHLRGEARFATHDDAEGASTCLAERARAAASNVIVSLYGLDGPLDRLDFRVEDDVLHIETQVRFTEIRTIAGLVRGLFERPAGAPPPTAPPPPSAPPPNPF